MSQKRVAKRGLGKNVPKRPKARGKLWVMAVDPFSDLNVGKLTELAKQLADQSGARVQATYLLAPAALNWTGEFSGPWVKRYLPIAEARLKDVFGAAGVETRVVAAKETGHRSAVKALLAYAQKAGAECLVLATHSRQGLERMALGSFAETLLLTAKMPVIIANPTHRVPSTVKKILVPTDLSKKSEKFVLGVTQNAKAWGAELVLFYKQPDPLDPIIQQGVYSLGGGWVSVQSYVEDELARKMKEIERLKKLIAKQGVAVSHRVDASPSGLIATINQVAQNENADMIAVLTQAGSWTAALLGSVARGLVREAQVPVLIRR